MPLIRMECFPHFLMCLAVITLSVESLRCLFTSLAHKGTIYAISTHINELPT